MTTEILDTSTETQRACFVPVSKLVVHEDNVRRTDKRADIEPLAASIDLNAPGKRIGHLELTWSDNAHAYGVIAVPIALIKDGEGPSVLVSAGVHGDEFEGLVIARRLIERGDGPSYASSSSAICTAFSAAPFRS